MPGIFRRQPQSRQGIRHDIGCCRKVFPGSRRKVHDPLNAGKHVRSLPARHRHIVHGLGSLGRGELRPAAHLPCLVAQGLQFLPGRPGDRRHLAHGRIKIRRHLHRRRGNPAHRRSDRHQLLPHALNGRTHCLQLLPCGRYLLQRHGRPVCLPLQITQVALRLDDLPLQGIILALGNLAPCQRVIRLLRRSLQRLQLLLRLFDRFPKEPVLLRHQFRIAGVQLQQLLHILKL